MATNRGSSPFWRATFAALYAVALTSTPTVGCGPKLEGPQNAAAAPTLEDPALLANANQIAVARKGDWDNLTPSEQGTFLQINGNNIAKAKRHYERMAESAP